jgi:predicted Mrr-cat superfamily restriction endonuclease
MVEFLADGIVALGWPGVGSLAGMDRTAIGKTVKKAYDIRDRSELGRHVGALDAFVNQVRDGDLVVVASPKDGDTFIGRFYGKYRYVRSAEDAAYPHQRRVEWLFGKRGIPRIQLPRLVASGLKAHQPIFSIDAHALTGFVRTEGVSKGRVPGSGDSDLEVLEGDIDIIRARVARRVRRLREAKIAQALGAGHGRLRCEVPGCGFDFEDQYGELGRGYIHVHHRDQLRGTNGKRIRKIQDLAIVCANCHAMIHRNGKCRELKELIPQKMSSKPGRKLPRKPLLVDKLILVDRPGFDPNRPDLQEFLNRVAKTAVARR